MEVELTASEGRRGTGSLRRSAGAATAIVVVVVVVVAAIETDRRVGGGAVAFSVSTCQVVTIGGSGRGRALLLRASALLLCASDVAAWGLRASASSGSGGG